MLSTFYSFSQSDFKFEEIVAVDSMSKDQIFNKAATWLATTYKSSKAVIQHSDKDNGIIVGKANFSYDLTNMFAVNKGIINYTITIGAKDNKYKIELSGFSFSFAPYTEVCWDFASEKVVTCSISKKERKKLSEAATNYSNELLKDFKAAISSKSDFLDF